MKFEIEVNENARQITMKGQDLDSSFSNSVYYPLGGLERAMVEKVSPWVADCVKKAKENKDNFINELLDDSVSITDIIYQAETNDTYVNDIIIRRKTKNLAERLMVQDPGLSHVSAYYRAQTKVLREISL